jgi:hypothetical protein
MLPNPESGDGDGSAGLSSANAGVDSPMINAAGKTASLMSTDGTVPDMPTHTAVVTVLENGETEVTIWYDPGDNFPVTASAAFHGWAEADQLLDFHGWVRVHEWKQTASGTRVTTVRPCPS